MASTDGSEARNSSAETHVRASFDRQGFMAHLAAELVEVGAGRCVLELPWSAHLAQQHGYIHGGACAALADTAAGHAALSLANPGADVLTVEFKINFFSPADGDRLRAEAWVLRSGRTLTIVRSSILIRRNSQYRQCGEFLGTFLLRQMQLEG